MQLGLFMMPQHPPTRTLYASWERDLELVRLADQLGYHEAWLEHFWIVGDPAECVDRINQLYEEVAGLATC